MIADAVAFVFVRVERGDGTIPPLRVRRSTRVLIVLTLDIFNENTDYLARYKMK